MFALASRLLLQYKLTENFMPPLKSNLCVALAIPHFAFAHLCVQSRVAGLYTFTPLLIFFFFNFFFSSYFLKCLICALWLFSLRKDSFRCVKIIIPMTIMKRAFILFLRRNSDTAVLSMNRNSLRMHTLVYRYARHDRTMSSRKRN